MGRGAGVRDGKARTAGRGCDAPGRGGGPHRGRPGPRVVDPEEPDEVLERGGLLGQGGRRRGELDAGRDVLMHDLFELPDAGADLVDRRGLLLRGRRDLADQVGGPADRRHDLAQQAAGVLGHRHAAAGELADLVGGLLAPLGELADLAGHHGEPLALGAGAGGLDRGVQGQQVRLVGDVLDDLDLLRDLPHRGDGLLDGLAAVLGADAHLLGRLRRGVGVLRRWPSPRCPRPPGSRRSPAACWPARSPPATVAGRWRSAPCWPRRPRRWSG